MMLTVWLTLPALDPLHLSLSAELFNADLPHAGVHGVFEDSLPDDWGRRLLVRRYKLGRKDQRIPPKVLIDDLICEKELNFWKKH